MPMLLETPALIALTAVFVAAAIDIGRFEIPDTVSIVVFAMAVLHGALHAGFVWWSHALAPVVMFAFGLLAFSRGWLGGGDVKLMTALAAWTGIAGLPLFFLAVSLAGGVLALVLMLARRGSELVGVPYDARPRLLRREEPLPYAVAIALGTVWWIWVTHGGPLTS